MAFEVLRKIGILSLLGLTVAPTQAASVQSYLTADLATTPITGPIDRSSVFLSFSQWLYSPQGQNSIRKFPVLERFKNLASISETGLNVATQPLWHKLSPETRNALSNIEKESAQARVNSLKDLIRVWAEAAPYANYRVTLKMLDLQRQIRAGEEPTPEELWNTAQQFKALSLYGDSIKENYRIVRRMRSEALKHMAEDQVRRINWGSSRQQPVLEMENSESPNGKIRIPLSSPATRSANPELEKDSEHWARGVITERRYARLLDFASQLSLAGKGHKVPSITSVDEIEKLLRTDKDLYSHSKRVGLFAGLIAWQMGYSMNFIRSTISSGLKHDIGKTDKEIFHLISQPRKLSPEEKNITQQHPRIGAEIIASTPGLDTKTRRLGMEAALTHHEMFSGNGYPSKIGGREISLRGRLYKTADALDALFDHRPYRRGLTLSEALHVAKTEMGDWFDPKIWQAFLKLFGI